MTVERGIFDSAGAQELVEIAQDLSGATDLTDAANRTIRHAVALTGARWAEMVEPQRGGNLRILAATDWSVSRELRRLGELTEPPELPGLQPTTDQIVIDDLWADARWPEFVAGVRGHLPVRSAVLQFIAVGGRYAAGLPVYDDRVGYFDAERQQAVRVLANLAGVALAGLNAEDHARNLAIALGTNRTIGTAVGIVMNASGLSQDEAYQRLVAESQRSNRKLRDVAEEVLRGQDTASHNGHR